MVATKIRALANSDHVYVVWQTNDTIPNCLGFALYRRAGNGKAVPVETFVGPAKGPKVPNATSKPSTEWPIQKYMWADYQATAGETLRYQVVPMCGASFDGLKECPQGASDWSNAVSLTPNAAAPIQALFNRGVVSTQWVARQLATGHQSLLALVKPTGKSKAQLANKVRTFLGGTLREGLLGLLESHAKARGHIYASLFELNDPEVIPALVKFGQHAHIILSDGTHSPAKSGSKAKGTKNKTKAAKAAKEPFDENSASRALLRTGHAELHDRMVGGAHFSHHKFIVFMDPKKSTKPLWVWTGSTNLTYGGICTQSNNGLLIKNAQIAARFFAQWRELVKDVNDYPASLTKFDAKPLKVTLGSRAVTSWFAPNPRIGRNPTIHDKSKDQYGDHGDLKAARALINGAKEGVLFLMLNPGPRGTLLNDILLLLDDAKKTKRLYIHGVANQDPTQVKGQESLIFVHRNKEEHSSPGSEKAILLPAAIGSSKALHEKDKAAAQALDRWIKQIENYWRTEPSGLGVVRVHSKIIVVDPFGDRPVIMTGSHNLGAKASDQNDDNLVIIENDKDLAEQYAVNIMTVYNQYRWRFQTVLAAKRHQPLNQWNGLLNPWKQDFYVSGDGKKEIDFWMG